ncbi:hypothetical protein ACFQDE_16605 [Deinococcus caeni]|uniref:hypothetical protein n=1 Tax=Deinococcus caeni TaxID=569127 RepID=UPI00360FACC6
MRLAVWNGNRSLHWGVTVPLSWFLVHFVNMRTTVDVEASWDQGYATLYRYGFPLGFTHWGTASSAEYVVFLGPLLLDWLVYLLIVGLVVGGVAQLWRRPVRVPVLLRVVLWGVRLDVLSGGPGHRTGRCALGNAYACPGCAGPGLLAGLPGSR